MCVPGAQPHADWGGLGDDRRESPLPSHCPMLDGKRLQPQVSHCVGALPNRIWLSFVEHGLTDRQIADSMAHLHHECRSHKQEPLCPLPPPNCLPKGVHQYFCIIITITIGARYHGIWDWFAWLCCQKENQLHLNCSGAPAKAVACWSSIFAVLRLRLRLRPEPPPPPNPNPHLLPRIYCGVSLCMLVTDCTLYPGKQSFGGSCAVLDSSPFSAVWNPKSTKRGTCP